MRSERLLKKRRRRIIIQTTLGVLGFIFLLALPSLLTKISAFQIQSISIINEGIISENEVISIVEDHIQGSYFYLFSKKNILIYPKQKIINSLSSHFSRIDTVDVNLSGLKSIKVIIVERKPFGLWCLDTCYFIDQSGLIFDQAPDFTDNVYITYKGEVSGGPLGVQYLDPEEFFKVNEVLQSVKILSLEPTTLSFLGDYGYSIDLIGGESIMFSTKDTVVKIISNLESVLSDPKLSLRGENRLNFSTLDLRYGNKVFFKKK